MFLTVTLGTTIRPGSPMLFRPNSCSLSKSFANRAGSKKETCTRLPSGKLAIACWKYPFSSTSNAVFSSKSQVKDRVGSLSVLIDNSPLLATTVTVQGNHTDPLPILQPDPESRDVDAHTPPSLRRDCPVRAIAVSKNVVA